MSYHYSPDSSNKSIVEVTKLYQNLRTQTSLDCEKEFKAI